MTTQADHLPTEDRTKEAKSSSTGLFLFCAMPGAGLLWTACLFMFEIFRGETTMIGSLIILLVAALGTLMVLCGNGWWGRWGYILGIWAIPLAVFSCLFLAELLPLSKNMTLLWGPTYVIFVSSAIMHLVGAYYRRRDGVAVKSNETPLFLLCALPGACLIWIACLALLRVFSGAPSLMEPVFILLTAVFGTVLTLIGNGWWGKGDTPTEPCA